MAEQTPASWLGLEGKKVIVTGGGSGIGRQVALAFAEAGALAAPMDLNAEGAAETARLIKEITGAGTPHYTANVADQDDVGATFERVKEDWGTLDVLANVAGVLKAGKLDELAQQDWNLTLNVDLTGAFLVAQGARRLMDRGGSIVHVGSIAGSEPQPFSGAYSPAKAGLTMLSRQLAFEWGPHGIRSNVVSPGLVRTPMSESFYQAPGVLEARQNVVPLRRIADPADMANVILFLASDRSSYVTGQDIVVDGGFSQSLMSHVPRPGFDS
jgi:NAD(P)-dependent dehydrogenase (short-subunit alcohol dehydrogenase family)